MFNASLLSGASVLTGAEGTGGGGVNPVGPNGEYVLNPSGGNDAAVLAALITAGAKKFRLGSGTFKWQSSCPVNFSGIHIEGNGQEATFISIDDSGGNIGDAFSVNSVLDFSLKCLTVTATAPRTAGSVVKVLGVNNITHSPVQKTQQYVIEDVNTENQFNGIVFNDGPGSAGAWGGHINRMQMTATSAGGVCIWVNSPNGGQHYVSNIKAYNDATLPDASRALAFMRYQGGNDLELVNLNSVYFRHGIMVDPAGVAANVIVATGCLFDNNTLASIFLSPQAGGSILGAEFHNGWGYTPVSSGVPCVQIDSGSKIKVIGGQYLNNFQAIRILGGATDVLIMGVDTAISTAGIYCSTSAAHFRLIGNNAGPGTVGIQIDAGCDHYNIVGNDLAGCTTPLTNTPGVLAGQREVSGNILT
jgi:hypothetical protein